MRAKTSQPVHEILASRRSPRSLNPEVPFTTVAAKTTKDDGSEYSDYMYDCGLAVAQLVFEVHHRGFVAHQMTGFDKELSFKVLNMNSDMTPVVVIAIGKQDAPEKLQGPAAERELAPRERKPLSEIVVTGLPN